MTAARRSRPSRPGGLVGLPTPRAALRAAARARRAPLHRDRVGQHLRLLRLPRLGRRQLAGLAAGPAAPSSTAQLFADSLPDIAAAFWVNVQLFLIAEILILVLALVIAVLRSLPGPVLFPLRLLSTVYVDVFRALPGRPRSSTSSGSGSRAWARRRADRPVLLRRHRAHADLLGLRVGGLPGGHRLGPSRARTPPRARSA